MDGATSSLSKVFSKYTDVYLFDTGNGAALFRLLPLDKYRLAHRISQKFPALTAEVEDEVWEECVIEHSFESSSENLDAGIVSTVSRIIFKLSCPSSMEEINRDIQEVRDNFNDVRDKMVIKICEAFPSYIPDDVEKLDWATLIKRVVQAEQILGTEFQASVAGEEPKAAAPKAAAQNVASQKEDGSFFINTKQQNALHTVA